MVIQLSEDGQEIVRSLVQGGRYASESEVVEDALRLLLESDEQARLTDLRKEIGLAIEQADRGELGPFDPMATLARVRARRSSEAEPT